ncbi:MAG: hypothetical protein PGN12_06790 [Sphingomonas phyllosphaerae]
MFWLALLLSLPIDASTSSQRATPAAETCSYDREKLALGFDAFDQDMKGGWRALADKPGCGKAAADMIRAYRLNYQERIHLLYWHEAQLRASNGDYAAAIPLMEKSRQPPTQDDFGWNPYVDATIAFLRNDRVALLAARRRLTAVTKPSDLPATEKWPPNLTVIDRLIQCFGVPYQAAYGGTCLQADPARAR